MMKRARLFALSLAFLPWTLWAQPPAKLNGIFLTEATEVTLYAHPLGLDKNPTQTLPLKNGAFATDLTLKGPSILTLSFGDRSIRLMAFPGESTQWEENRQHSLEFSGKTGPINALFQSMERVPGPDWNLNQKAAANTIDALELDLFAHREQRNTLLKIWKNPGNATPPEWLKLLEIETQYLYYGSLLRYPFIKAGGKNLALHPLPRIIFEELQPLIQAQEKNMSSPAYRQFVADYVIYYMLESKGFQSFQAEPDLLSSAAQYAKEHLEGTALKFALARLCLDRCGHAGEASYRFLVGELAKADAEGPYLHAVKAQCDDVVAELSAQVSAEEKAAKKEAKKPKKNTLKEYPYPLYDREGKEFSLNDFLGKVVYVDFWASWCGPCRAQFPYAAKLHEQLSPKEKEQVIFLYINLDDTQEKWKDAVEQLGIKGVHGWCPGAWGSEVAKYYQITSIPRYLLINQQGDVVNPNSSRPADPETLDRIRQLLGQKP